MCPIISPLKRLLLSQIWISFYLAALLNNLIFPNEGDWPMALSILPFLAQGRALYIVLVYHASTAEVTGSLLLMFGVGSIMLILAFLIDEHGSIGPAIAKFTGQTIAPVEFEDEDISQAHGNGTSKEVSPSEQVVSDDRKPSMELVQSNNGVSNPVSAVPQAEIRRELDEDLRREKVRAAQYVRCKTAAARAALLGHAGSGDVEAEESLPAEEQARLAIVLHKMKFRFPTGGSLKELSNMFTQKRENDAASAVWAVNGLSLALSLGECFGLLGPNGAGRAPSPR
jgi:hypothetical protein